MAHREEKCRLLLNLPEASVLITPHVTRSGGGLLVKPTQLWLDNLKGPLSPDSKLIDVIMGMSPCHPSTFIEFWQCAGLHVKAHTHTRIQLGFSESSPLTAWPGVYRVFLHRMKNHNVWIPASSPSPHLPLFIYLSTMVLVGFEDEL